MHALEENVAEEPRASEQDDNAIVKQGHAIEVILVLFMSVFMLTLSIFHVFTPTSGSAGALRVFGSMSVDCAALFFVFKGFALAVFLGSGASRETYQKDILQKVLPLLVVSVVPWILICAITNPYDIGYWMQIVLTPLCMGPFFDFRKDTAFRGVNEGAWFVQTTTVLILSGEIIYAYVERALGDGMTRKGYALTLLCTWFVGFTHLYVSIAHPSLIPMILRSPLTNLTFFSQGIFLYFAQTNDNVRTVIMHIVPTLPFALVGAMLLYLHHADTDPHYADCQHTVGGTPCLWIYDACNLRYLPFLVALVGWCISKYPSLLGENKPDMLSLLDEWINRVRRLHPYCPSFFLFAEIAAMTVHVPIASALPDFVRYFAFPIFITELVLVTLICILLHEGVCQSVLKLDAVLPNVRPYLGASQLPQNERPNPSSTSTGVSSSLTSVTEES